MAADESKSRWQSGKQRAMITSRITLEMMLYVRRLVLDFHGVVMGVGVLFDILSYFPQDMRSSFGTLTAERHLWMHATSLCDQLSTMHALSWQAC